MFKEVERIFQNDESDISAQFCNFMVKQIMIILLMIEFCHFPQIEKKTV